MGTVLFETRRLRCRQWDVADLEPLFAVYSDAEAMRWVGDGEPISRQACKEWLEVSKNNYLKRGYGMFALEESHTGVVVGFCGLVHPGGQEEVEVKYAFLRSRWGEGLASEAIPALLSYGASTHSMVKAIATVASENMASQRVLLKSGMQLAAVRSNANGSSTHVYEWLSQNAA